VRYRDARVSSFVAKVREEVFARFHAAAVKRHSRMWNWLFGLPGRILSKHSPWFSKKIMNMLLALLFTCLAFFGLGEFGLSVYGSLSFPNACLNIVRVSVALFQRFAQNVMHIHCRIHCEIAPGQIHDSKWKDVKINMSTQLREILYTNSQDMLVLSCTVASRYYNYCTDGGTSPGKLWIPSYNSDIDS
jgi:hypothetical protein